MTLGGYLITYNCIKYDFCFVQAIECLHKLCDEVAIVDGRSTDGTWEKILELAGQNKRFKLAQTDWKTGQFNDPNWVDDICSQARKMLTTEAQIFLCADEILDEREFQQIRQYAGLNRPVAFKRLTFWGSPTHYLPNELPVRIGPINLKTWGFAGELAVPGPRLFAPDVNLYHYSFLRSKSAMANKMREFQTATVNQYDPLFDAVETQGYSALTDEKFPTSVAATKLIKFEGTHPACMHTWLKEHGYDC